jgi:hypothetical protein
MPEQERRKQGGACLPACGRMLARPRIACRHARTCSCTPTPMYTPQGYEIASYYWPAKTATPKGIIIIVHGQGAPHGMRRGNLGMAAWHAPKPTAVAGGSRGCSRSCTGLTHPRGGGRVGPSSPHKWGLAGVATGQQERLTQCSAAGAFRCPARPAAPLAPAHTGLDALMRCVKIGCKHPGSTPPIPAGAYLVYEYCRTVGVGNPKRYDGSWVQMMNDAGYSVAGEGSRAAAF